MKKDESNYKSIKNDAEAPEKIKNLTNALVEFFKINGAHPADAYMACYNVLMNCARMLDFSNKLFENHMKTMIELYKKH